MLETEIRAPIRDPQPIIDRLRQEGCEATSTTRQLDIMLDRPDASLFRSGRKLRVRIEGERAELTYKGPFEGDQTASRRSEITVPISNTSVDQFIELFAALGFPVCFQIPKQRLVFRHPSGVIVTLDEWPIVGWLLELEGDEQAITTLGQEIAPEATFGNYRLSELLNAAQRRENKTFSDLKAEYESMTGIQLGQIELILE